MEQIFKNFRKNDRVAIVCDKYGIHANTLTEVYDLCSSLKDFDCKVNPTNPVVISFSVNNVTMNEQGKDADYIYRNYMAQDYDTMREMIASLSTQVAERVCGLMTPADTIQASLIVKFYDNYYNNVKNVSGLVIVRFHIYGETKQNMWGSVYRPVKREYEMEFKINELSLDTKIFEK